MEKAQPKKKLSTIPVSCHFKKTFAMASFSTWCTNPIGEESGPFTSRLNPISDKINILQLSLTLKRAVLFALLTSSVREACNKLQKQNISIGKMIFVVKRKIQFDSEIQDRRIICLTSVDYSNFWRNPRTKQKLLASTLTLWRGIKKIYPITFVFQHYCTIAFALYFVTIGAAKLTTSSQTLTKPLFISPKAHLWAS